MQSSTAIKDPLFYFITRLLEDERGAHVPELVYRDLEWTLDELGRHDLLEFLVENVDYDGDSYFIPSALMRSYLEIQESRS